MENFVAKLCVDFPHLRFVPGPVSRWSPQDNVVNYSIDGSVENTWGVLHELGHALLNHQAYQTDIELLRKETAAWAKASLLSKRYAIDIAEPHIQECLDTYRNWLFKRSSCPACGAQGIQIETKKYNCLNCRKAWNVTATRFCRPYRLVHS